MEDELIVELYLKKDESAIVESARKYGKSLRMISYNILRNFSDVQECENDTYFSAWNNIPPSNPKEYLFSFFGKIIRNLSFNLYKKNHRKKRFAHIVELSQEMEACIPAPSDEICNMHDTELSEHINDFLSGLSEEEQSVFIRRYWFADSIKDIAKQFRISESKTKSMLMRT